jgi:hypothetical protein
MSSKAEKVEKIETARGLVKAFWGSSREIMSASALRSRLSELRLKGAQLEDLRDELPVSGGSGTTGQRIATADRVLERMAR